MQTVKGYVNHQEVAKICFSADPVQSSTLLCFQVVAPVCISKLGAYRPSSTLGSSPLTAGHYMIAEDQTIVSGSVLNVVDALMLMFAAYYCLNISYRSELGATLEFLQRESIRTGIDTFQTIPISTDDTTVIGLITVGDETPYREEDENLTSWCQDNNLHLNVSKTKELIVDYRKQQREGHAPIAINGTTVWRDLMLRNVPDMATLHWG
ncbi:uncharacterized protein LOC117540282 [Gymnodraco acuticeps]|uniref:Uncharacterized protein LOC117540282 n=1 Tax=Gymnodraco acuticeps TaxID=8218 RepID=A0A6P8TFQ1_GYMAC|nr:uncharacterized protein LOC117540282 [Gymnodraco acuticeps]